MDLNKLKSESGLEFWFDETEHLTDNMQEQLFKYYLLIHEYNKHMNLTGIDDLEGVYLKHFYDSLTIEKLMEDKNITIGDLGSGAGFPGIILSIIFPNNKIYLIEPLGKRCKFLEVVIKELGLTNTFVINKRAEEIDMKFDVLVSRAVARLNILLELAIPLVKVDGFFIALKGAIAEEEIAEAKNAMKKLCAEINHIDNITLPIENSCRSNIKFHKIGVTPKEYPRNFGQIKKKPL